MYDSIFVRKGYVLIYKPWAQVGLIKYDENKLCRVYEKELKKLNIDESRYNGLRVKFELDTDPLYLGKKHYDKIGLARKLEII